MLRFLDAGESHGKALIAIIEGMPSNLPIDIQRINDVLNARQNTFGRGDRKKIENDRVEILSGIRNGKTLGSPICLKIENKDWENWKDIISMEKYSNINPVTVPRPGHADLTGAIKYNQDDIRNILERSSARETAIRTAVGCIAMQMLENFKIKVLGHVRQIGNVKVREGINLTEKDSDKLNNSSIRCIDEKAEAKMIELIENAKLSKDTLGGIFEIHAFNVPIGLGSCMHYDRKLDAKIAFSLMSIQGIKGVEFGMGFEYAQRNGPQVHDEIYWGEGLYYRKTNNAGGIEGGMSNGELIVIKAVMKPIPTLYRPLKSIDIITKQPKAADVHRSDICAVPAACIVGENVTAWEIACAINEKFGGDSIEEMMRNYEGYIKLE